MAHGDSERQPTDKIQEEGKKKKKHNRRLEIFLQEPLRTISTEKQPLSSKVEKKPKKKNTCGSVYGVGLTRSHSTKS